MDSFGTRLACLAILVVQFLQFLSYIIATTSLLVCGLSEDRLLVESLCWNVTLGMNETCIVLENKYAITIAMSSFCVMVLVSMGILLPIIVTTQMACNTNHTHSGFSDRNVEFRTEDRVVFCACTFSSCGTLFLSIVVCVVMFLDWYTFLKWEVFVTYAELIKALWILNMIVFLPASFMFSSCGVLLMAIKCDYSQFWKNKIQYFTYKTSIHDYRGLSMEDKDKLMKEDLKHVDEIINK